MCCALSLSTLSLTACDDMLSKKPVSTETEAITDLPSDPEPIAVKTVNGMSAYQLFGNFYIEYSGAKTYDISIKTDSKSTESPLSSSVDIKLSENALYINVEAENTKMECWFFEDAAYLNIAGEKVKISGTTADDIFGKGFIEQTLGSALSAIDTTEYNKMLKTAQLYSYNGEYYYTLALTEEEAEKLGIEAQNFSETVFFNEQGKVKRVVDSSDSETVTMTLNAYDTPVSISAPADADSYIEQIVPDEDEDEKQDQPVVNENAGNQDPLLYATYQEVFDAIKNAHKFEMIVSTNGSTILFYTVVKNNAYTKTLENDDYFSRWYVDGKGYASGNNGTVVAIEVTESFLSYFNSAKEQKDFVVGLQLHGNDMNDFSVSKEYSSSKITLSHNNTDGTVDFYEITAHYLYGKVESAFITITRSLNGQQIFSTSYDFLNIDSVYLNDLVAPM